MNATSLQRRFRLPQLRLLVAIAEHGSVAKASHALHITQPAATKALKQLEEAVGDLLVARGSGGSALTPIGELLCKRARVVLSELRDAEEELGLWHSGGAGHVIIGALPVATPMLIPEALREVAIVAPRITVTVIEGSSDTMARELQAGNIDMLVGRFWPGEDPELRTYALYESTFRLNVRAGHPLEKHGALQLRDVVEFPWVLPPPGAHTRAALEDMFRNAGLAVPAHPVETTSYLVIRSLILNTDAVAPLPIEVLHTDVDQGIVSFLPIKLELRVPSVGVVQNARRTQSPAASTVMEQIRKVAQRAQCIYSLDRKQDS